MSASTHRLRLAQGRLETFVRRTTLGSLGAGPLARRRDRYHVYADAIDQLSAKICGSQNEEHAGYAANEPDPAAPTSQPEAILLLNRNI